MTNQDHAHTVRANGFLSQMRATDRAALAQAIERQDMAELERAGIARRIKQARKEAGLSQPEMADAIGVISRTYQNYESLKDPRTPWGSMNDIAKITGKSTEWLIHGERPTPDLLGEASGRDEILQLLASQEKILKMLTEAVGQLTALLGQLPVEQIRALTDLAQRQADAAEAEAKTLAARSSAAAGKHRRRASDG